MSAVQRRRRSKVACEPCRTLKRKCDGAQPCASCVRFEYDCAYHQKPPAFSPSARSISHGAPRSGGLSSRARTFQARNAQASSSPYACDTGLPLRSPGEKSLRSLEANSGAAFVRRLALRIDPNNAPRAHLFAWNPFMGSRCKVAGTQSDALPQSIIHILSQDDMDRLAGVYFRRVDPIYGFIDRNEFDRQMKHRWFDSSPQLEYDAVLCGVAALGYLYSHVQPAKQEWLLVHSARLMLESALSATPTATMVTAWVLRVTYLRITGTPHAAWMASGILMHMVEAAGLHCEPSRDSVLPTTSIGETVDPDIRRRIFGISQHLNTWMSFDMARSRIVLHNATTISPKPRSGDLTVEILGLLPYATLLNPDHEPDAAELEAALVETLDRDHSDSPSVMGQCNLMLCLCRRLKSQNIIFTGPLLVRILEMTLRGIRAAQVMIDQGTPWHHMANVPFQVVCILLAIDTGASIAQLQDAMQCLSSAAAKYQTEALHEALGTASLLILLHQRRKERSAATLDDILRQYPVPGKVSEKTAVAADASQAPQLGEADVGWLDGLVAEIPSLQDIDLDAFLSQEFLWDSSAMASIL